MRDSAGRGASRPTRPGNRAIADRAARPGTPGGAGGARPARGSQASGSAAGRGQDVRADGADGAQRGRLGNAAEIARLTSLLRPVLAALDLDLEDIKLGTAGRRRVLRVIVDADGGIDLDDIAQASREISAKLDRRDAMGEAPYTLEVSSPGVDRPLTEPRHWRRATGRLVVVPLAANNHDGERAVPASPGSLTGRVVRADSNGVTLAIDGVERTLGYSDLGPGRVQVEFGRPGDGGADEEGPDGH